MASDKDTLERLEARLERLEGMVGRLTDLLDQAMPALAMFGDIADELVREEGERGVDVDARARAAVGALRQGGTPEAIRAAGRMASALPGLETPVAIAAGFDDHVAMAGDIVDAWARERMAAGDDVAARVEGVGDALLRLTEPSTLSALVTLAEHAKGLELAVGLMAGLEDHVAMFGDIADELAARDPVGVDARARAALHAADVATRPENLEAAAAIADRLPGLAWGAGLAAGAADHVGMVAEIVDDEIKRLASKGIDVDARLANLGALLGVLSDPEVLDAARRGAHLLPALVGQLEAAPGWIAMAADAFDESLRDADALSLLAALARVRDVLSPWVRDGRLQQLADLLADHLPDLPGILQLTGEVARILETRTQPVGLFAALRATSEPEVQVAIGAALEAARLIGGKGQTVRLPSTR